MALAASGPRCGARRRWPSRDERAPWPWNQPQAA